ncbi:MAG: thioesterase family protein [Bacteroidota bacterium]
MQKIETYEQFVSSYPIITKIPVQWGEMDLAGHVNNVVYCRYAESGRVAYCDEIEFADFTEKPGVIGPIAAEVRCKYVFPVTYPDTLHIGTRVTNLQEDRFVMWNGMFSEKYQRMAAICETLIVSYDYFEKRKVPIPQAVIDHIHRLEGVRQP